MQEVARERASRDHGASTVCRRLDGRAPLESGDRAWPETVVAGETLIRDSVDVIERHRASGTETGSDGSGNRTHDRDASQHR